MYTTAHGWYYNFLSAMKWIRAAFRGWGKLWNGYEDAMKYQPVAYEEAMKIPQNSENSYEVISWYIL